VPSWQDPIKHKSLRRKRDLPTPTKKVSSLVHTAEGFKVVWNRVSDSRPGRRTDGPDRLRGNDSELTIVDVGTGSGAIAVTAKLEHPEATVYAIDIDDNCLKTARKNAKALAADIKFLHGNLLEPFYNLKPIPSNLVLLCNLPYVPDNFQINTAATHEPRHALFGGPDGLDLYRELFKQITTSHIMPVYILAEIMPPQHEILAVIAKESGYKLTKTADFIQQFEPA